MARTFELTTPLGTDVLLFHRMTVTEELGRLGDYKLDLLSERGDINLDKILGQRVTIKMELPDDKFRYFTAYVTRFAQVGTVGRYHSYQATLKPWFWFLTRTADCRMFQEKTAAEIIKEVLGEHPLADFKLELTGTYRKREYCVQYRETDFNFLSRIMEEEGMYYYFRHGERTNTLVLADAYSAHSPSGKGQLPFIPPERFARPDQDHVSSWQLEREVQPGKYVLDDHDFQKPSVDLQVKTSVQRANKEADSEVFDYPGEYLTTGEGDHYVLTRMEELQAQFELAYAETNARDVAVGHLLKLTGHTRTDQNREYLIVAATHQLQSNEYESADTAGAVYQCNFTALHSKQAFRPRQMTPRPTVQGPQTAVVVGPSGDEIYTDKYGRVKVQFRWDRLAKGDQNSSCWIRVSHPWAGKNWGMIAIPRIGQEVIVDFLEGDPDQPIITGRVYNAEQMPPWELPANMTQTGVLTRSSKGGSGANANAIRFEDKKGSEQLWIHAEKNQDIEVENDETHWVGHDRTKTIDHDETSHIKHDRTETVDNNETITIHGQRTEVVDKDETITIHMNRTETVDKEETITIHGGRTETVDKNESITISGGRTEDVSKDESITIGGGRTENVAKEENITIGGGRTENVAKEESITIGGGRTETVAKNESITISGGRTENVTKDEGVTIGGGRTVSIGKDDSLSVGKNLSITAADSITITTGSASITMKKDGTITIKGKDITIEGSGKINAKASSDITMKGSKILQN
jgi:type VI secretion system secreted protein VgrG